MEYKKINELTAVVTGGTPSTRKNEYWDNGDIPWLQSGCCQNCDVDSTEKYITKEGYNNSSTHMMPADTVMIALTGATAGKVGYLKFEACGNQSITGILPCESLNQRYLFFYLLSQREKILADCVGGAQAHISQSYVKNMSIPIVAINEQEQIVVELTKLSNIVLLRQKEIQQLDNLVKARFVEMFGDLNINDKGWKESSLMDVCSQLKRYPTFCNMEYQESGVRVIRIGNILIDGHMDTDDSNYVFVYNNANVDFPDTVIEMQDIVMAVRGDGSAAKRIGIIQEDKLVGANISPNLIRIQANRKNIEPVWLFYYLTSEVGQKRLDAYVNKTAKKNIAAKDIARVITPVPDLHLQKQYVGFIKQVDKSKVAVQKALNESQILFDSLMQKYFG